MALTFFQFQYQPEKPPKILWTNNLARFILFHDVLFYVQYDVHYLLGFCMNEFCPDCENGEYRPAQKSGILYWIIFLCGGFLFLSLTRKRRFVCPTCGRFYK